MYYFRHNLSKVRDVLFCAFLQDILWLWPFFQEVSVAHCCIFLLRQGWKQHASPCWMECDTNYLNSPVFDTGMSSPCHFPVCLSWKSGIRHVRAGWWVCAQHKAQKTLLLQGPGPSLKGQFPWMSYSSFRFLSIGWFLQGWVGSNSLLFSVFLHWSSNWLLPEDPSLLSSSAVHNWDREMGGSVCRYVCLGKLSVLDCNQLLVFSLKKQQ